MIAEQYVGLAWLVDMEYKLSAFCCCIIRNVYLCYVYYVRKHKHFPNCELNLRIRSVVNQMANLLKQLRGKSSSVVH